MTRSTRVYVTDEDEGARRNAVERAANITRVRPRSTICVVELERTNWNKKLYMGVEKLEDCTYT